MSFDLKLEKMSHHKEVIEKSLTEGGLSSEQFIKLSKELAELTPVVNVATVLFKVRQDHLDLNEMLKDPDLDLDMKRMIQSELEQISTKIPELEKEIQILLLPRDEADEKNAIMEIRAGTGGDEAALFAGVLMRMYQRYAEIKGWKFEILTLNQTDLNGIREATFSIIGKNVFSRLKFESGVHRVQRVPETETQGRVHTSAATVAVLPEAEEIDIKIEDKDLRIDVFRSSGPGGQSVNTTDSAVRITHLPSGLVVQQQDEKSQHKNKAKALKILRSRIYDMEREKLQQERSKNRNSQIGRGDRSERIRTYNYSQSRVTDHRINLTLYKLDLILNGEVLDSLIEPLIAEDQMERLSSLD